MANEYIVPIGGDLKPLIDQISKGQAAIANLSDAATAGSKEMDEAFKQVAATNAVLVKSIEKNTAVNKQLADTLVAIAGAEEKTVTTTKERVAIESQLNKELAKSIDTAKAQLATLKEGSKEYNKLAKEIAAAEVGLKTLNKTGGDLNSRMEKLRKTFNENRAVLQNLAAQGLQNTKIYKDLEKQTGELSDTINDVNEAVKLAGSDTRNLDNLIGSAQAITGAFSIAQGAVAVFGAENENVEKALLKVNAALSILNGLQAIQSELKRKDSLVSRAAAAAQAGYATVVGTSTGALKLFRIALASTGIGLVVIAIGALIANFDKVREAVFRVFPGLETLTKFMTGLVQTVTDFVGITSEAERALDDFVAATEKKNKSLERTIKVLEAQGGKEKEIYQLRRQQIQNEIDALNKKEELGQKLTDEEYERRLDLYSDLDALDAGERKRLADVAKQTQNDRDQAAKERERKAKEAADKLIAIEKDQAERILAFDKQYRDLKIAAIEDEFERAKAAENARFVDALRAAQKSVDEFKGSEEQRQQIQDAANRVIERLNAEHFANLTKLETDYRSRRIQVIQNANALAGDVFATELERDLANINAKYEDSLNELRAIIEKGNDPEALNALNRLRLAKQTEILAAEKKARDKAAEESSKSLQKQEEEYKSFSERVSGYFVDAFKDAGLSDAEANAVFGNIKKVFGDLQQSFLDTIDAQIEGKQRQIDALSTQIDEAQSLYEKELELQKAGYANNVGAKEEEIERLKELRHKELEDEKRLRVERAKLESLSIAQATIAQTVDLGSAAAKIFKAHSGIPFVGVGLALAAVASMFAGFLAIKNKIKAAQDAVPKFRHGKELDIDALKGAASHESGGVKMVDNNSGRVLAELEGNEKLFVVNKLASAEYEDLLNAINNNDRRSIASMLAEIGGVHLEDLPEAVNRKSRKVESIRNERIARESGLATEKTLAEMKSELNEFKRQERKRPVVVDYGDHVEVTQGDQTKIYKKGK